MAQVDAETPELLRLVNLGDDVAFQRPPGRHTDRRRNPRSKARPVSCESVSSSRDISAPSGASEARWKTARWSREL